MRFRFIDLPEHLTLIGGWRREKKLKWNFDAIAKWKLSSGNINKIMYIKEKKMKLVVATKVQASSKISKVSIF